MLLRLMLVLMVGLVMGSSVQAAGDKDEVNSDKQKKIAEQRKEIEERVKEINGSKWEVVLSSTDPKVKEVKDTFLFQDKQMTSTKLSERGFGATNYTVSLPSVETDFGVWETMKTGAEGVLFMRGEWNKERMRGTVTEQLDGGKKVVEYSFKTESRQAVSPTSKENKDEDNEPSEGSILEDARTAGGALVSKEEKE